MLCFILASSSATESPPKYMGKYMTWIHQELGYDETKHSVFQIYCRPFSPSNPRKPPIARPLVRGMVVFSESSVLLKFTFEFIVLCAAACYVVPRYIESIVAL